MKYIISLSVFFFNYFMCSFAQTITGRLIDNDGTPLSYLNIALYNLRDSTFLSGTISNENGFFSLPRKTNQDVFLRVSGIGYETDDIPVLTEDKDTIKIGDIIIKASTQQLKEIVVNGKRRISFSHGGYTLSVSGTDMAKQPDVFTVISFLPFVTVNGENVSMINKGRIMFVVNGHEVKDMYEIKRLKPEQIKNITVKPHSSLVYDSEYDAVIEIRTVAKIKDYLSAQIRHSSVLSRKYSDTQSLDLNFQKSKWYGYLSYTFNNINNKEKALNKYFTYDNDNMMTGMNSSENRAVSKDGSHKVIFGLSYRPNAHQTADFQYLFTQSDEKSNMNTSEESRTSKKDDELETVSENHQKEYKHNILSKYQIDFRKSKLIFNISYIYSTIKPTNDIYSQNLLFSNIYGKNKYYVFTSKADYDYNISNSFRLQLGSKYSFIKNSGSTISIGHSQSALDYENNTNLKDNMLAMYGLVSYSKGSLNTFAGIRTEYTKNNYTWNEKESINRKSWSFYPSIDIEYDIRPSFILDFGFKIKGTYPKFNELSPMLRYINSHLYEQGNGNLKKKDVRNIYLAMVLFKKISVNADYYHVKNFPIYVFQEMNRDNSILVNSPININIKYFELNVSYSDKFGLYRFAYNGLYHQDFTKIPYLNGSNHNKPEFMASMVNQFDITKRIMLFCNLDIASSYNSLGTYMKPAYGLTSGAYLKLFSDNRLTAILSFNDILHKSVPDNHSTLYYVRVERTLSPDTRNIMLTFRYNINKFVSKFHKHDTSASEESRLPK